MSTVASASGQHVLADFHGVAAERLRDGAALEGLLRRAAAGAGARILGSHFHSFGEQDGVTGVVLLAESHISIHTWPESQFAAIDIFMCGTAQPDIALALLTSILRPARQQVHRSLRGVAVE